MTSWEYSSGLEQIVNKQGQQIHDLQHLVQELVGALDNFKSKHADQLAEVRKEIGRLKGIHGA